MKYFLDKKEIEISKKFKKEGYIISKINNKKSLNYIKNLINYNLKKILRIKNKSSVNLNNIHLLINKENLNEIRVNLISAINKDKNFRFHYFSLAKEFIYILTGNELMMQKNINLSIQFPNDKSSLLPVHSDVWSGDSPHEINLWVPLVNCYKTKSMYILKQKDNKFFEKKMKKNKYKNSEQIFNLIRKKVKWINIKYGEFLLFNQSLPHGNVENIVQETRVSMNCRFKTLYSPYGDKKIGEFFLPITTRAMSDIAMKFEYPFKK